MIHEANHVRPNHDGIKVGGHQASSASIVSILTALYFRWLRAGDLVAIKPHASPGLPLAAVSARQPRRLDAHPAARVRRAPVVPVADQGPGPGGLLDGLGRPRRGRPDVRGARRPLPARSISGESIARQPERRFVALVGDAELDEGNVWEAVARGGLGELGNVTMIVDLNRQSLDRVVPGIRIRRVEGMFAAAGWHAIEAKYGRLLQERFALPGGDALRERIDDMENEEYQVLIRRPGPELRERLLEGAAADRRDDLARNVPRRARRRPAQAHRPTSAATTRPSSRAPSARPTRRRPGRRSSSRTPSRAGGCRSPATASTTRPISRPTRSISSGADLGIDPDDVWAGFAPDSPEGHLAGRRRKELGYDTPRGPVAPTQAPAIAMPDLRIGAATSTQQAFGDTLAALARDPEIGSRIVTAAPTSRCRPTSVAGSTGPGCSRRTRARTATTSSDRSSGSRARPGATSSWASAR